jgi:hypothetical protein
MASLLKMPNWRQKTIRNFPYIAKIRAALSASPMLRRGGARQFTPEDGNGSAAEHDPLTGQSNVNDAAARRCLEGRHDSLAQPPAPIRPEAAMCRPGYRILVDADAGCEET